MQPATMLFEVGYTISSVLGLSGNRNIVDNTASRGGLGELGHFLYFDTVCFTHLSYYILKMRFFKKMFS